MKFTKWIRAVETQDSCGFVVLVDPDKFNPELIHLCNDLPLSCFFVGGSKLHGSSAAHTVKSIKKISKHPVVLFPGETSQITKEADGLLVLSLLSGRNAEYLIGQQVRNAALIKKYKLPTFPVAYLLIQGNKTSTTQKVTRTQSIPQTNYKLLLHTCLAAKNLGFRALYLEAGSGAKQALQPQLLKKIKREVGLPLIVGGGIKTAKQITALQKAGANLIVVGNALEKNVYLVRELSECFKKAK